MRLGRSIGALMLLLGALPAAAWAAPVSYVVVPERSSVSFRYTENGVPKQGEFRRFAGAGRFDQASPDEADLSFAVESASIDLGNRLVNAFASTEEWFDSTRHPEVRFRLTHLAPVAPERYIAEGLLTIRGETRGISAPVRLAFGEGEVMAEGDLRVDRAAYGLGLGASQAFVDIGREVSVVFALVARPVAPGAR